MRKTCEIVLMVGLAVLLVGCSALSGGETPTQPAEGAQPTQPPPGMAMPTAVVPSPGVAVSTVAARVNGQEISMATFQKLFFQFKVALTDQGFDLTTDEGRAALAQVRMQVLNSLIELALVEQAAARMGITVSDEQVNARVQEAIVAGGGEEKFQTWLQENGITEEEFSMQLRSEMITEGVIQQITNAVSDKAEQVRARHILVGSEEKAHQVLQRLEAGEDFAAVAREMSEDEVTRADGGDLGFFPKGMLSVPPEVEEAAFALQPGQISGIVRSPYGYHIIQVVERQPDRPLAPEVYQAMKQKAFDQWLQEQRATADIEILIPME